MEEPKQASERPEATDTKLRTAYYHLFHEMQFRCTKNALMNYQQAEIYQDKGDTWKAVTSFFTAASASGILASIIQKGQILANKVGVAGLLGLPVFGAMQLLGSSTSEFVPSYLERARKHAIAAAGWMQIADTAKAMQVRLKIDPNYDLEKVSKQYDEMLQRKEMVSKEVLIPRETHSNFHSDTEKVYLAMTKRNNIYQEFLKLEAKQKSSAAQITNADDIYV
ncbi:unnamed protein product [Candidula unifasciata]|uniref:Uncharacterized protein n=1 Tax=Candidula unifasciata TaxID=100452 RepID=A0A8S3YQN5_9EUPU|nr:unnamed protein product [Candidula unifasciata]